MVPQPLGLAVQSFGGLESPGRLRGLPSRTTFSHIFCRSHIRKFRPHFSRSPAVCTYGGRLRLSQTVTLLPPVFRSPPRGEASRQQRRQQSEARQTICTSPVVFLLLSLYICCASLLHRHEQHKPLNTNKIHYNTPASSGGEQTSSARPKHRPTKEGVPLAPKRNAVHT